MKKHIPTNLDYSYFNKIRIISLVNVNILFTLFILKFKRLKIGLIRLFKILTTKTVYNTPKNRRIAMYKTVYVHTYLVILLIQNMYLHLNLNFAQELKFLTIFLIFRSLKLFVIILSEKSHEKGAKGLI